MITTSDYAARFSGAVEFRPSFAPRPGISHVLFDFDGTLSIIREGWPDVMVPMFTEYLPPVPGETAEQRRQLALDDIMRLNGKQTIYQMIQLAERITERGGQPREPLWYKHEYLRRLEERIASRVAGVKGGTIPYDDLLVHGTRALLVDLRRRGMTGKVAEEALHHARITVNKNAVPDDPQKPWVTSGIRVGTPALTTRGMGPDEMRLIGAWMAKVLEKAGDAGTAGEVEREVLALTQGYPLFSWEPVARTGVRAG